MQTLEAYGRPEIMLPLFFFAWVGILLIVKKILFLRIARWAGKSQSHLDDVIVESLRFPVTLLIVLSGAYLVRGMAAPEGMYAELFRVILASGGVLAAVLFATKFLDSLYRYYPDSAPVQMLGRGVTRVLVKAAVPLFGLVLLLYGLGIPITPLLASLGIGSLAVALALQDTLSNFFAGLHIVMDKPLRVGDFVRLEGGQEGYVTEVGWRSTRIRTLPNNVVVVPNNKLTSALLMNYYLPDKSLAVLVEVGVHYGSDLKRVEQVVVDVGRRIMQTVTGADNAFEPFIRFHTFAESGVNFTVILRGKEFTDQYLIKHEFIKALHARFKQENIVMPYPTRTLDIPEQVTDRLRPSAS